MQAARGLTAPDRGLDLWDDAVRFRLRQGASQQITCPPQLVGLFQLKADGDLQFQMAAQIARASTNKHKGQHSKPQPSKSAHGVVASQGTGDLFPSPRIV